VQILPLDDFGWNHCGVDEKRFNESLRRPVYGKKGVVKEWDENNYVNEKEDSGHVGRCLRTNLVTERNQATVTSAYFLGLEGFKR